VTKFWQDKSLQDLSSDEWEALCDGCGRCCLNKLEDEDTAELYFTNVACRLLDLNSCRCRDYAHRAELVPECLVLSTGQSEMFEQLPSTCAYRLRAEGRPLPAWHPLVSGDPESVHIAGISVRGKVVSEEYIHPDQLPEHMISWVVPGRGKYTL
jgi:uncharacterized cysteine cluster protein YcgN (CxxCxxCC family)